jgi:multidrug efflux pump subunit AcrA (membrane-fusion protein)
VHRSLDVATTAYTLANDGRILLGCDRLCVLTAYGKTCRVRAMSGVDTVDGRSPLVSSMERLAAAVLAVGEPLWTTGDTEQLPPRLEEMVHQLIDHSHARTLAVVPLSPTSQDDSPPDSPGGALLAEWFAETPQTASTSRSLEAVARHGGQALANAEQYQDLPFVSLIKALSAVRWLTRARQLPRTVLVFLALAATVLALVFIPADFFIEARGALQPEIRRDLFAPNDGVVDQVHVEHADYVSRGELLVELRNAELDFEYTRILGEIQTNRQQLDSVQAARLQSQRTAATRAEDDEQLAAREEELKEFLVSLVEQQAILEQQKQALQVASPIEGQVLTWDTLRTLDARPVQRGQLLVTVVDPAGPWILEVDVPDYQIGYILDARQRGEPQLPVTFILATDPGITYRGYVKRVAMVTDTDETNISSVLVMVTITGQQVARPRPNASVIAKIHCGRQPLGYVWFHDLIEFVRRNLLF